MGPMCCLWMWSQDALLLEVESFARRAIGNAEAAAAASLRAEQRRPATRRIFSRGPGRGRLPLYGDARRIGLVGEGHASLSRQLAMIIRQSGQRPVMAS